MLPIRRPTRIVSVMTLLQTTSLCNALNCVGVGKNLHRLSFPQYALMHVIAGMPGLKINQYALLLNTFPQIMRRMVLRLIEEGLMSESKGVMDEDGWVDPRAKSLKVLDRKAVDLVNKEYERLTRIPLERQLTELKPGIIWR